MNTTQHNVNRDMILLYFLGILHPDDCRRVEHAVRADEELMEYFKRQLALAELTDEGELNNESDEVCTLSPSVPIVYYARSEDIPLAANHFAHDRASVYERGKERLRDEPALFWKEISTENTIELRLINVSDSQSSDKAIKLDVELTYMPLESRDEVTVAVGLVALINDMKTPDKSNWKGKFSLDPLGLKADSVTIMTLKGTRVESK